MTSFARSGNASGDAPCRWADVEGSEGESDEENEVFAPPAAEDSCRSAMLEESCGGLKCGLRGASARLEADHVGHDLKEAVGLQDLEASAPEPATSSLNASAAEFVPTLTMVCPLVGYCCEELVTPQTHFAADLQSREWVRPSPTEGRRRQGVGRKRNTPPALQVPDRRRADAQLEKSKTPMPDATEEEWQQRIKKRQFAINAGKKTQEYRRFQQLKMNEEREDCEPLTPDPLDRSLSKRAWNHAIDEWRKWILKQYGDEGHGSVASTEEWLSVFTSTTEEADGTATTVDGDEEGKDEGDDNSSV